MTLLREPHGVTGAHHSVELSGADVRPHARAGAGDGQRGGAEARRGRLPVRAARSPSSRPRRAARQARSTSSPGIGEEAGAALCAHPGIDFVSLHRLERSRHAGAAGGRAQRRQVRARAGRQVAADRVRRRRPRPRAAGHRARRSSQNAGQTCTAGSRLLVRAHDLRRVRRARRASSFRKVRAGTPEMDLDCGPVINAAQHARVKRYVERRQGATAFRCSRKARSPRACRPAATT